MKWMNINSYPVFVTLCQRHALVSRFRLTRCIMHMTIIVDFTGMTVMRIINEPTAAAIAYGLDKKEVRLRLG